MNHVLRTAAVVHRYLPFQCIIGQKREYSRWECPPVSGRSRPRVNYEPELKTHA
jgi:hypothetical protein